MFSISKNRPLISPSIKQAISHSHGYPFPVSPGSAGGLISRMVTPLPSPLINQFNSVVLKTPPVGQSQTLTGFPFPSKIDKLKPRKNLRFQSDTEIISSLTPRVSRSKKSSVLSNGGKMSLSARRRTTLRLDLQAAVVAEEIPSSSNLSTPDIFTPMDTMESEMDVNMDTESFKPTRGRVSTPYFQPHVEMRGYLADINGVDINPYKGDWLDRSAKPGCY